MKISFHGAAKSVTGSRHLVEAGGARVLLDCGMFQGRRQETQRQNRDLGFDPKAVDAVLLSHAHVDHSGALPSLAKQGFSGKVYLTRGTGDLATLLLEDSARIQEGDCAYVNKREARRGKQCVRPLYDRDDVRAVTERFIGMRYDDPVTVRPRVQCSFHDAGHILGSAAVRLTVSGRGNSTTVLFTGDLGRAQMPILRDPEGPPPCDVLIIESTYGDRVHEVVGESLKAKLQALVEEARTQQGKIIVPAFAIGRTQELVMRIKELVREGRIEPLPIYIDSPMAAKATEIFRRHPEYFDEETRHTFTTEGDPFSAQYIRYVGSQQESQKLNNLRGPCLIISASGMCEGGRIVHHLKHAIQDPANTVVIVGFQAEHTLGRKLIEGWDIVPIFGVPTPRRARIERLNGLSAHADRNDLLAYVRAITPPPSTVCVVHGEERQALAFAEALRAEYPKMRVIVPDLHATYDV